MRRTPALFLFVAAAVGLLAGGDVSSVAQDKKAQKKKAEVVPPDDATKAQIAEKTEALRKAVADLKAKKIADRIVVDVEVFLKAAEWIVRHNEWLTNDAGKQTLRALDIGAERAKSAAEKKTPWALVTGKWVARGYRSRIDGSVQPYALLLPESFIGQNKKPDPTLIHGERMDVVLHGRDATLTEVKFLSGHDGKAGPKGNETVLLEVYGRGNNAYRWAGETDVFEAMDAASEAVGKLDEMTDQVVSGIDRQRIVLRGFSMGGAGAWHIGLHHPGKFAAIGPGAGFTTTHGYIAGLPKDLPLHVEKCLRIYDAVGYAENAFNVPVVAYSGEKDAQKKAADNIENALKGFKEPLRFKHLVAPGLEHQMPAEWQGKAEVEFRKHTAKPRPYPERVRLVTYTPRYGHCDWVHIGQLETMYERAVVDATLTATGITATTTNVQVVSFDRLVTGPKGFTITIDGQAVTPPVVPIISPFTITSLEKRNGKWGILTGDQSLRKSSALCGPIDAAFLHTFRVIGPTADGWHAGPIASARARQTEFARLWDKYFRGDLPNPKNRPADPNVVEFDTNLVLFGDPQSNPKIAEVLPKLPITWTKDELVVNSVKYDPNTHLPVLIYPNPLDEHRSSYVVLNSGHTFGEADLKGTNALLYPRLGDWAVIKPTPTEKDPAAFEVVAAGLFDENWKFK